MIAKRTIAPGITVSPLALGTNVFGWTADTQTSCQVLDAYVQGGGNFLDTADSYSFWAGGNTGGESETIIGKWLTGRSDRDDLVIATKVSNHPQFAGMAPETIRAAIDASLTRLDINAVDIYYAHYDDPTTPLIESIATLSELVDQGKIRSIGISNYTAERIKEWLDITAREGFHAPVVVQPQYNLVERGIEAHILPLARNHGLAVVPYYSLAHGFLTGKYDDGEEIESPRAPDATKYLNAYGRKVIAAVKSVAEEHSAQPASIALAWLATQNGVAAPIASARTTDQLSPLVESMQIQLSTKDLQRLDEASQL